MTAVNWSDFTPVDSEPATGDGPVDWSQFEEVKPSEPGFIPTIKRTGGQMLTTAATTAEDVIGPNSVTKAVRETGQGIIDRNPAGIKSLRDLVDSPWLAVKESVGQFAPQIGAAAAGGLAGARAGGAIAGPAGAVAGGAVGSLLPIFTQEYGGIRQEQKESGQEDKGRALAAAIPATALERVGMGSALKVLKGSPIGTGSILKEAGKGVLKEGATEGAQNVIEQWGAFKDPTTGQNLEDTALAAVMGGIGGGVMGGATGAVGSYRQRTQQQADAQAGQNADGVNADAGSAGPDASPLALGNTPDPLISFPDGSVGRQSEVDKHIDSLPQDQRVAARAKLMGYGAQPADASLPAADALPSTPQETQQLGYSPLAGTPTVFPDGSVALGSEAEFAHRYAPQPARPSQAMGIDPAAGPLSKSAALAVDSGAYMPPAGQVPAPAPEPVVLQNRDRTSAASIAQMQEIAANPDYLRVGPSRDMTSGAPVVFGELPPTALLGRPETVVDGHGERMGTQYAVVDALDLIASNNADGTAVAEYASGAPGKLRSVAGNGRTAGLQAAYQLGTAQRYRQELAGDAAALGVDAQALAAMQRPVLVRVMQGADVTRDMGDRTNITATQKLSPLEQAGNDARRLDVGTLSFDEGGNPTPDSIKGFVSAMPVAERGDMLNADGTPTRQAVDRLMAATFKQAYESDELVQLYAQASDPDARAVMAAAADASGVLANLKGAGEFDVRAAVAGAAKMAVNAARQGMKLSDVLQNADLDMHPEAFPVAAYLAQHIRTPKRMAEGLRRWGQLALEQARIAEENTRQGSLLGPRPTLTRAEIFARLGSEDNPAGQAVAPPPAQAAPEPVQAEMAQAQPDQQPQGEPNGNQADQAQQAAPQQPEANAPRAVERHPTWRQNAIQAGRVARDLGLQPKGKRLAQIVAEIDARDSEQNQAAAPAQKAQAATDSGAEAVALMFSRSAPTPQDFVSNPDGGLDYGEITPEMGKAMRRQAGVIRLQQGVQNADGTGHGLAHIEANHGAQIRALGFDDVSAFVSHVAGAIQQVWQVPGNSQLLVTTKAGRKDVMYIQLEIAKEGDFYRVNSAFPVRQQDYEDRRGMKKIWDGSEPTSTVAGQRPAFATAASASPEAMSSQGSSNARGQETSVPPKAPDAKFSRAQPPMSPDLARTLLALGRPPERATKESVRAAVRELVNGLGLLPNSLGRIVVATSAEIKQDWEPLIGPTGMEASGDAGKAQGFYDPKSKTVFLIADNIKAGDELGVVAHELMHKHGPAVLGKEGWNQLHGAIGGWAKAKAGSMERIVHDEAARRVKASGPELSNQELFPYAVQVALEMGVRPNAIAPQGTVARWLGQVRAALRQVWSKIAGGKGDFNSLDLVNLAFGIAQRENPAHAGELDNAIKDGRAEGAVKDQTQTEAFRRWFGDSKVVDAQGRARIVFHGTAADFSEFSKSKATDKDGRKLGMGWGKGKFYFAETGQAASSAAQFAQMTGRGQQQNVMPVYLSVQRSIDASDYLGQVEAEQASGKTRDAAIAAVDKRIRAQGIDGIMDSDTGGIAVFDPRQIKSATGNNGQFDPSNADIRFSRATVEGVAARMGDAIKAVTVTNLKEQAGFKATDYMGLGLQLLGRRQLVDVYGKLLPQLSTYNGLMAQMDADKNEAGAGADELATAWGKLDEHPKFGLGPAKYPGMERKLAELMHDATLAQIDPAKDFVDGDNKTDWMRLRAQYQALSPAAREVYGKARDIYSTHMRQVRSAIKERIERSEMGSQRKAEMLKRMDDEFFGHIKGVYFPLARFGQYVVVVKDAEGKTANVSRAETMAEAQAARQQLQTPFPASKGFTVGKVLKAKEFVADRDTVGRGFMEQLYGVLDKQGMDSKQKAELEDALGQLYLSALPDLSWAKHGIHRKGTPGFSQDARRAFAQNVFHGASYLAKLRYSDQLQDQLSDMEKYVSARDSAAGYDSVRARQVVDEMQKRHESAMNPKSNSLSTALTSLGFIYHLGLSPASAMVNLTQTALVAYPVMGAKWGYGKASAALMKASQEAVHGKNDITGSLNTDEKAAYDEAVRSGVIDVTMAHDLAGIAQGEDSGVMWKFRPVMKWASFLFHHAEKFNRQVTFVAAYRLARETGAEPTKAYTEAVKATYDGHFDYSSNNRPRVMQGNAARVLLLFKQYGQNMVYTLARSAQQSLKGATPKERAEARKTLGGLLVMHGMAAGALGLPMVTTLLAAASMLGGDDDEPWDAQVALQNMLADTFGQKPAEVLSHGISRLTPWDISGRVGLDKLIFPDIQEGLEGQRLGESAMAAALGPVAGIGINVLKGLQEMGEGRYQRGLETMAPSVLRGPVKAWRYGTEGVRDKSGIVVQDEVDAAELLGQASGFSPSSVRNSFEGKSAIVQHDRVLQARRSSLVEQFAMAAMARDEEGKAEAREAIAKFNEKNPGRRILPMQLAQSVRMRTKRIEQAQDGVYLPSKRRDAMEAGRFATGE